MVDRRRELWERRTEWPLTTVALAFLAAYAWPILDPRLPRDWLQVCNVVTVASWGTFAADYLTRLVLSNKRRTFVRVAWLDLLTVVLPLLRPLRLLRLVRVLSVLNRRAGSSLRGRVAVYVAGSTALVLFVAALAMLDAERGAPGSNIATFRDSFWWAATTVTTVGYGDRFPVTDAGRVVAGALMLAGIALLGVVTASVASWLIERVAEVEADSQAATRRDIAELSSQITALRNEVGRLRSPE
jgi:voltage-gated potassium channel